MISVFFSWPGSLFCLWSSSLVLFYLFFLNWRRFIFDVPLHGTENVEHCWAMFTFRNGECDGSLCNVHAGTRNLLRFFPSTSGFWRLLSNYRVKQQSQHCGWANEKKNRIFGYINKSNFWSKIQTNLHSDYIYIFISLFDGFWLFCKLNHV